MSSLLGTALFAGQTMLTAIAFVAAPLTPPREGKMLLVPLGGGAREATAVHAAAAGASILGPGRLPGSMLVAGGRSQIVDEALPAGIVAVNAAGWLCGEARR